MNELVQRAVTGEVATITLDSPDNRNALSRQLIAELSEHLAAIADDSDVKVVVLTHTGATFCSGADLSEMAGASGPEARKTSSALVATLRQILTLPQPVVARIGGHVRAGGLGLLGACDLVVVTRASSFAFTEARLGVAPAVISLTTVPRLAPRTAAWYLLSAERFDGGEAATIGLATTVVEDDALDTTVAAVVGQLTASPRQGLAATKRLLVAPLVDDLDRRGAGLAELSAELFASDEAQARLRAFLDRRPG